MSKNKKREFAVYGIEAVKALCKHHPEKIYRLFFAKEQAKFFGEICKYLASVKKPYKMVEDKNELEKLSQSTHHQGAVAMIPAFSLPQLEVETILQWRKNGEIIAATDAVGNANNLGAIIRSAAFFGIKNIVIVREDKQAEITPAAYRVAQGGMEFVNIYSVSSMPWFLTQCRGKITVIGADHNARHKLQNLQNLVEPEEAVVIVMGNEETGLKEESVKLCNHLVKISGNGNIESLNVAQACTLFLEKLYEIKFT